MENFRNHTAQILDGVYRAIELELQEAAAEVRQIKTMFTGDLMPSDTDQVIDVGVTVDGSWNNRNFSSLVGLVFALSVDTGKVLDYVILSKICGLCREWEGREDTVEFQEWYRIHENECDKNHTGSAKSMEAKGAVLLFERSLEKHRMQYTIFVGDGDSAAYKEVVAAEPYGPDVEIIKEDCSGHIQKRMGTALRKLLQDYKGKKLEDGKGLGGRGRLTHKLVDTLQVFYGLAIRNNKGDVDAMQREVQASVHHYASTLETPQHDFCPKGQESWCKYQSDLATGKNTYRPLKHPIPEAVCTALKPVYDRLSSPALLEGVKNCRTQNANEGLHNVVWSYVPKEKNHGNLQYQLGVAMATGHFNSGFLAFNRRVYEETNLTLSDIGMKAWETIDRTRVNSANYKAKDEVKKRRKLLHSVRSGKLDKNEYEEGTTYESSHFYDVGVNKSVNKRKKKK